MLEHLTAKKWLDREQNRQIKAKSETVDLRHPVLLCHGYGAIASLVKPSPLHDVAMLLRSHQVPAYAPPVIPYAKIEIRAQSWVKVINELSELVPGSKINIIAHSMGGLDIRYALSKLDVARNVASLTTISTPHRGTSLAELTLRTPEPIRDKMADFLDWIGNRVYPDGNCDSEASAVQLTRSYITEMFNPEITNSDDVPYYSYSSAVGKGTEHPISVIARYQNNHIYDIEGPNDGMVSVESAKWGEHIKTSNLSHLEQMNLRVKNGRQDLYRSFWLDVIKMLQEKGH